jgi:hypothetical protein
MIGSSGSDTLQSPLRLSPKVVYAMRSTILPSPTTPIPDKTRYLHYDNLGSIDTITDGQGNIVERMAYTTFGERRKGD